MDCSFLFCVGESLCHRNFSLQLDCEGTIIKTDSGYPVFLVSSGFQCSASWFPMVSSGPNVLHFPFFLKKYLFMHLFLTVLGLICSMQTLHWSEGRASLYVLPGGLVALCEWDLRTRTRDWTHVLCFGRWILNHWTTREVPFCIFKQTPQVILKLASNLTNTDPEDVFIFLNMREHEAQSYPAPWW